MLPASNYSKQGADQPNSILCPSDPLYHDCHYDRNYDYDDDYDDNPNDDDDFSTT